MAVPSTTGAPRGQLEFSFNRELLRRTRHSGLGGAGRKEGGNKGVRYQNACDETLSISYFTETLLTWEVYIDVILCCVICFSVILSELCAVRFSSTNVVRVFTGRAQLHIMCTNY